MPRTQGIALLALGLAFAVPDQAPLAHTPQQKATVAAAPAAAGIKERLQHLGYPLLGGAKKLIEVLTSATVPVGPFPDPSGMLKEHQVMVTWWCDQPTHGETCAPPPAAATIDMCMCGAGGAEEQWCRADEQWCRARVPSGGGAEQRLSLLV